MLREVFDFLFTRQAPAGWLWTMFCPAHLAYIGLAVASTAWFTVWFRRLAPGRQAPVITALGWWNLAGGIIPTILLCTTDTGERWIDHLPLHLCSSAFIVVGVALVWRWQPALNYLWGLCLPGAVAAIATPGVLYTYLAWGSVHYLLFNLSHLVIIWLAIAVVVSGLADIRWRYYPWVIGLGVALIGVAYPVNKALGSNYMFANWPEPGTILEAFARLAGVPGYVLVLIGVGALVVAGLYAGRLGVVALATRRTAAVQAAGTPASG